MQKSRDFSAGETGCDWVSRSSRGVLFQLCWEGEEILWILPVWAQGSQSEQGGLVWELLLICEIIQKHTHTPHSLSHTHKHTQGSVFQKPMLTASPVVELGDKEEEVQWILQELKTGNQSSDNAAVPPPPLTNSKPLSLPPQFPSLINGHMPVPLPNLEGTPSSLLLSPATHKSWSRVCEKRRKKKNLHPSPVESLRRHHQSAARASF